MARFSLTDLRNKPSEVVEAALKAPVEITRHGKRTAVLLAADFYDRLAHAADVRRAFHANDVPKDVAAMMLSALERGG
jgi:prevent-host-death family protein